MTEEGEEEKPKKVEIGDPTLNNEVEKENKGNVKTEIGIKTDAAELSGKYVAGTQNITEIKNILEVKDRFDNDNITCPTCGTKTEETGTVKCRECDTVFFVASDFSPRISSYPNLASDKNDRYKDLIAHISNFTILGNYIIADEFCSRAIDLSPATPQAWEYKAFCNYFLTKDKKFILDTNAEIIYRYLLVAKSHYVSEEEIETVGSYKGITEKIADRIYNMIRHRIAWVRRNKNRAEENELSELIYAFRICFRIHPYKSIYLETLINMYSGYDKESWIDIEVDESEKEGYRLIDNTHLNGDLFDLINYFKQLIQELKSNYELKEFKGGEPNSRPRKVSELYQEKFSEYQELKQKEWDEKAKKERMEREFEIRFKSQEKREE